jgi:hypothetical protein
MEGYIFKERRESLEELFGEINTLIEKKSKDDAQQKLKEAKKEMENLSEEDLSEIQQRVLVNRQIQFDHIQDKLQKLIN